jgi:hypothetical protein
MEQALEGGEEKERVLNKRSNGATAPFSLFMGSEKAFLSSNEERGQRYKTSLQRAFKCGFFIIFKIRKRSLNTAMGGWIKQSH